MSNQNNDIKIIFEDEYLMVLEKPAGILVHPTPAIEKETLVDFLKLHAPNIEDMPWQDKLRAGIVHRLDKDTSGLIVVAKNPTVLTKLQAEFKKGQVQKTYLALVLGAPEKDEGKIEANILRGKVGLQKVQTTTYSFSKVTVRPAVTLYKTIKKYQFQGVPLALLEVLPKTGRMHQIRVHLKYLGAPIIGDPLYNTKLSRQISKKLGLSHQFLHAQKLEFKHPVTQKKIKFKSPLPNELNNILAKNSKI